MEDVPGNGSWMEVPGNKEYKARREFIDIVPQFCDSAISNLASTAEASPLHCWNGFLKLRTLKTHGQ